LLLQVLRNWASLQRSQWMNRTSLAKLQNRRLRKTVHHACQKVPFYQKLYKSAGVDSNSITSVKDIAKLPITRKEQLRAAPLQERTASGTDLSACRVHTTSGSTGATLTLLEDPYSAAYRDALNLRFLWAYGVRPLDKVVRLRTSEAGGAQPGIRLADRHGAWAYVRNKCTKQLTYDTDLNEHLQLLSMWKPDVLMAATPYCKALATLAETTGKTLNFRVVVTSAVLLDDSTRKFISDKFGAEVYDHYGIAEVGGSLAWECPSHSGYHVNAETLFLEFLNNGEPVMAGRPGEVHVTSFCRVATPIIRYFIGDIAVPIEDECSCGRGLHLIKEIQGRTVDYIATQDGRHVSPFAVINSLQASGAYQFKVTQREDYLIEVSIITHQDNAESLIQEVQHRCRDLFRETPFEVQLVDRIDNAEDRKFRVVESRLAV